MRATDVRQRQDLGDLRAQAVVLGDPVERAAVRLHQRLDHADVARQSERRIALLPLSDGNPFTLARLVPGVAFTGDLKFSRPFDNAGSSAINADGSSGGNEFSLDGSPNMANGRRVAFVPPAGAVLICTPLKIENGSGSPLRVLALVGLDA